MDRRASKVSIEYSDCRGRVDISRAARSMCVCVAHFTRLQPSLSISLRAQSLCLPPLLTSLVRQSARLRLFATSASPLTSLFILLFYIRTPVFVRSLLPVLFALALCLYYACISSYISLALVRMNEQAADRSDARVGNSLLAVISEWNRRLY